MGQSSVGVAKAETEGNAKKLDSKQWCGDGQTKTDNGMEYEHVNFRLLQELMPGKVVTRENMKVARHIKPIAKIVQ